MHSQSSLRMPYLFVYHLMRSQITWNKCTCLLEPVFDGENGLLCLKKLCTLVFFGRKSDRATQNTSYLVCQTPNHWSNVRVAQYYAGINNRPTLAQENSAEL